VVLFVVHTLRQRDEQEVIRIISARPATARERKAYEETYPRAKARHSRRLRKKR
jgi:uncharacterized DUF497 family protein